LALLSEQKNVRDINYLSKDFDSIKSDLINLIKQNYPDSWSDFNESSGGMAMLEMVAYVGDVLSFYIDRQVNESFINRAVEEKNILANAQELGYMPRVSTPAIVNLSISADLVNSISSNCMFQINKGSRVRSSYDSSVTFEILEDVDFSSTSNRTASISGDTINLSKTGVSAMAGSSKVFQASIGDPTKFLKINLPDRDITEIVSVTSSDGYEWYQVDYLAQGSVFVGEENTSSSSGDIPYVMKMKKIPRRFKMERETGRLTSLVFGPGTYNQEDSDFIPNPEDFVQPASLRGSPSGFFPSIVSSTNFLNTRTLGMAPRNVVMSIKYRQGGGVNTNVGSHVVTQFSNININYKNAEMRSSASGSIRAAIERSISVDNPLPAGGGRDAETFNEIRNNASAEYSSQGRCVTLQDYQVRVLTMPNKFGSVFRSYARKDIQNNLGVELVVISIDGNSKLTATNSVLKNNIETYIKKFKTLGDTIRITDGKIVNIGIDFSVVPANNVNYNEALLKAIYVLRKEFNVRNSNFGAYIAKSQLVFKILELDQILAVPKLEIVNLHGTNSGRSYSSQIFNVQSNTRKGIIYFPNDVIYEVKYLDFDIAGAIG